MGAINASSQQDRRHHRRHRRHRLPDQHPGAERGGGSGARRRAGPRLRGGGRRSAQPGAALGRRRQGNQGPDRRLGRARSRRAASWSTEAGRTMDEIVDSVQARDRHHGRDHARPARSRARASSRSTRRSRRWTRSRSRTRRWSRKRRPPPQSLQEQAGSLVAGRQRVQARRTPKRRACWPQAQSGKPAPPCRRTGQRPGMPMKKPARPAAGASPSASRGSGPTPARASGSSTEF